MAARVTIFERLEEVWVEGSHTSEFEGKFFGSDKFRKIARMEWIMDSVAVYVPRRPDGCPDPDTIWTPRTVLVVAKREAAIPPDCRVAGLPFFRGRVKDFWRGQTYWYRKWVGWEEHTPEPAMSWIGGCRM